MSAIQDLIKWFHNKHIFCITDEGQDIMDKVYEIAKNEPLMYTQAEVDKIKHDAYNKGWHDTVNEYADVNCIDLDDALGFADWIAENYMPNGRKGCWDSKELNSIYESKFLVDSTKALYLIYINSKK